MSPGDVETFTYDVAGRLRTANNRDARVSRTYLPGGTIATDTLRIRSWDPADTLSGQYDDHVYWLSFQNDLLGRRLRRDDSFGRRQAYVYHDSLGVLTRTSERPIAGGDSLVFTFTWDSAGRMSKRQVWNAPIEINESQTFDANGRLATRVEAGRISGTAQAVFSDAYTYDFRGKQRRRTTDSPDVALQDSSEMLYDGFGAVVAVTRHRPYGTMNYFTDEYDVDALGNVWGSHFNRYTNAGRSELNQRFAGERMSHQDPSPLPTVRGDNTYFPAVLTLDSASFTYDASGNQVTAWRPRREFHSSSGGLDTYVFASLGSEFTFHFYDAAERLRFTQRSVETTGAKHTMLDYRYDALGRRVLVRTRTDSVSCSSVGSGNTPPCLSTMDRYVWDGDQLLVELRGPGHWTLTTDQLDAGAGSGAYFGQVRYLHALGIDAPLAVRKGSATPFVPHASGRGGYEHGTYVNGDEMDDYHWPQRTSGVYMGADARIEPTEPVGWFGSLLEGKADASGLQYMRNRYYDPASGRFTQRDPIGLKGGLNQYSFAASDPVNGSDPFGLKVCFDGNPVQRQQLADSTMKATGTKFDLRWDNTEKMWCAANVRANGAWTWIARAFKYMVENSLLTLPIQQGATSANAGGRVWIDFSKIGDAYYDNSVFCTLSTTGRYTGPSIIAHELGHAYVQFLVTAPPPFTGEISWYPATDGSALAWENHVNVTMNGLAARVRGCDHP